VSSNRGVMIAFIVLVAVLGCGVMIAVAGVDLAAAWARFWAEA
jgi:hypothetical protein